MNLKWSHPLSSKPLCVPPETCSDQYHGQRRGRVRQRDAGGRSDVLPELRRHDAHARRRHLWHVLLQRGRDAALQGRIRRRQGRLRRRDVRRWKDRCGWRALHHGQAEPVQTEAWSAASLRRAQWKLAARQQELRGPGDLDRALAHWKGPGSGRRSSAERLHQNDGQLHRAAADLPA